MKNMRNRAWRRAQNRNYSDSEGWDNARNFKPEKNWKHIYCRSNKLSRAKQLGFDYPVKRQRQLLDQEWPIDAK